MDLNRLLRPLGEIHDKDTQFTAAVKTYQPFVLGGALVLIGSIIYLIYSYSSTGARSGTWRFGLCKVFAEQYESYPTSIKMLMAEESQNSALLEYLATNAYGAQVSTEMECFYNRSPQGVSLARVTVNRKSLELIQNAGSIPKSNEQVVAKPNYNEIESLYKADVDVGITNKVSQIHIDEFNKSIGVIMATDELDLTMPAYLAEDITDLKYD